MNYEFLIIHCIRMIDEFYVAALPWLRFLAVIVFFSSMMALQEWNKKRSRPR